MKIYRSKDPDIEVPNLDPLTFLFESNYSQAKESTTLHVEAANPANSINKSEARDIVKRIAHTFRHKYGIGASGPGKDVIVCTSTGSPFLPVLFYSTIAAGGIFSGASTAFTAAELSRQVADGEAKLLLCSPEFEERTLEAAKKCGVPPERVLVIDSSTAKDWKLLPAGGDRSNVLDLRKGPKLDWVRVTSREELAATTGCLLYSSGTTGLPKGVCLSYLNLVASCVSNHHCGERLTARLEKEGKPFVFKTIAHLPMAHIAGVMWYTILPFYSGGTVYWLPKYDFDAFIAAHRKFRPTMQYSVPPIWLQIAKSPKVTDHFDNLHVAQSGAAPMGYELATDVSKRLGRGRTIMGQSWGATEGAGGITGHDWDDRDETYSAGSILPNVRLRFLDENDQDVTEGSPGEILASGPLICKGYHNRPEANRDSFLDGFYRTGDIGVYKDGYVYIVDRKKELIKYKGLQVAPAELEATLIGHAKIDDAAVIGVYQEAQATEVPRAYVVKTPGQEISEEEVKEFVRRQLASHKQLRGGVVFVDVIPKSPSGKILRKEIREWVKKETAKAKL